MSKSDENVNGFILLEDDPDTIRRKIKKCVTDSEGVVKIFTRTARYKKSS